MMRTIFHSKGEPRPKRAGASTMKYCTKDIENTTLDKPEHSIVSEVFVITSI
jgi:hypothetical protein